MPSRFHVLWIKPSHTMGKLFAFHAPRRFPGLHPLEGGLLRIKRRRDRRPGLALVNSLVFYPQLLWESMRNYAGARQAR